MSVAIRNLLIALMVKVAAYVFVIGMPNPADIDSTSGDESALRLYSGTENVANKAPYLARLDIFLKESNYGVLCSAVYAGYHDFKMLDKFQKRTSEKTIIHPMFTKDIAGHDFVLLKVDKPFEVNDQVQVIRLSNDPWPQDNTIYKRPCTSAGWGATAQNATPGNANWHKVIAKHGAKGCKCMTPDINTRLVCLDETTGSRPCPGDLGGPLVCGGKLVGVSHHGYMGESCDPSVFKQPPRDCKKSIESYMYICPELKWIGSNVPGIPSKPKSCKCSAISNALTLTIAITLIQAINLF